MADPFDIGAFIDGARKTVDQAAGDALKGAGDIAQGAAGSIAGAAEAAASAVSSTVNNAIEAVQEIPKPKPQYRNDDLYLKAASQVTTKTIMVNRMHTEASGEAVEGYKQILRMSSHGIELLANALSYKQSPLQKLFASEKKPEYNESTAEVVASIQVRNCSIFKRGTTGGADPLVRMVGGAASGGTIAGTMHILTVPVGVVGGAIFGLVMPSGAEDVWYLDLLDYDGTEWAFKLQSKEDGEVVAEFLDAYFHL